MAKRHVLLLEPRGTCAGVEAAVQALAWLVLLGERPLQCLHHIVHNERIVERFERLGVTFVEEPSAIEHGATVMLSAHGTGPSARAEVDGRAGWVIDAVCPLVGKVHREIVQRAAAGSQILYVGRRGHDEVDGAMDIAPGRTTLVESVEAIALLPDSLTPVAVLAQTTLRVDEVEAAEAAARDRFGTVWTPARSDICDASTTRQAAVRAAAKVCDVVVIVGSASSSNTASLLSTAQKAGVPTTLQVGSADELPEDLTGTIGITAGASTPDDLVDAVIRRLDPTGEAEVFGEAVPEPHFSLPSDLRRMIEARVAADSLPPGVAELARRGAASAEQLLQAAEALQARLASRCRP